LSPKRPAAYTVFRKLPAATSSPRNYFFMSHTVPNSIELRLLCLAISKKETFVVDYSVNDASSPSG